MWNIILIIAGFFLTRKEKGTEKKGESDLENSKTWNNVVVAVFFIAGYLIFKSQWDKQKSQNAFDEIGTNPNNLIATQIRDCVNPSGSSWLIDLDFTNVSALMTIAAGIRDWKGVQAAYQALYTENLSERLSKDLSREEFVQFMSIVSGASASTGGTTTTTPTVPTTTGNKNKYNYGNLPQIGGKKVVVNPKRIVVFKDTGEQFPAGSELGAAIGWKNLGGVIHVVYIYRPHWYSFDQERTVDANSVKLV